MPRWSVYMVRCADGSLYTGISNDVPARVAAHNGGSGAKYTRSRLPVALVWSETCRSSSSARKKEARIKTFNRAQKEQLVATRHLRRS